MKKSTSISATIINASTQSNKLFIVCPFCQMEHFIRKHFKNALFISAPAGILQIDTKEEAPLIKTHILQQKITDIYSICDTNCHFIQQAVTGKQQFMLNCEYHLSVYADASRDISTAGNKITALQIAAIAVQHQLYILNHTALFGAEIANKKITLHGIVSNKNQQTFYTIQKDGLPVRIPDFNRQFN
ncbi:MAG TPA: hypothetical protein PKC39_13160 [Ferruginibacter sp.]|nr:hypothetical protein [Ferruginibacter sp.]HMP21902.1 hypothetical protein [Ferruginibacter sp.]